MIRLKRWIVDFEEHAICKLDGQRNWIAFEVIYHVDNKYCWIRWPAKPFIADYVIEFILDNLELTQPEKRLHTH